MKTLSLVKSNPKDSGKVREQDDLLTIKTQIAIAKYEQFVPTHPPDRKIEDRKPK